MSLTNMLDSKNLDLAVSEAQGIVGLANMLDLKNIDIIKF
jgi:hypothetical protein